MPAEAGLDRSLPRARVYLFKSHCKLRPQFFGNRARRAIAVVILEHEPVCGRRNQRRIFRLPSDSCQRLRGIIVSIRAALIGRKIKMPEAIAARQSKLTAVLL